MMLAPETIKELQAPLNKAHVRQRQQSGRKLDYIEGWHAIAEANRIFGFDGWTRETIDLKCVAEHERKIGQQGASGWGVTYIAKVRITVGAIIREGCGTGHGIDRDLGQAHESALKEAETDAMKRAFMTFGNPFGLALYDKEQRNVCVEADQPKAAPESKTAKAYVDTAIDVMTCAQSKAELSRWWSDEQPKRAEHNLTKNAGEGLRLYNAYLDKLATFSEEQEAA